MYLQISISCLEKVFADEKENHAMRYAQYRGLTKVTAEASLWFVCVNLKKLAMWKTKNGLLPAIYYDNLKKTKKKQYVFDIINEMVTPLLKQVTILSTV